MQFYNSSPLATWLRRIFGNGSGYLIALQPKKYANHSELTIVETFEYSYSNAGAIASSLASRATVAGDVYIKSALYPTATGIKECDALPSRFVVVDDVQTVDTVFSALVHTSTDSYHGYFILDQDIDTSTRRMLQEHASSYGSRHAIDVGHAVRIPLTLNTKYSPAFNVVAIDYGTIYTLDQLKSILNVATDTTTGDDRDSFYLDWEAVAMIDVKHILKSSRWSKVKPHIKDILHNTGSRDDTSKARFNVMKGLAHYGFSDIDLAALMIYFDFDVIKHKRKSLGWLKRDIERILIDDIHPLRMNKGIVINPTNKTLDKPIQKLSTVNGRPKNTLTPEAYMTWLRSRLEASQSILLSRYQIAEMLKVSEPTIRRLEQDLTSKGMIERVTSADRKSSIVRILSASKLPPNDTISSFDETYDTKHSNAVNECVKTPAFYSQMTHSNEAIQSLELHEHYNTNITHPTLSPPTGIDTTCQSSRDDEQSIAGGVVLDTNNPLANASPNDIGISSTGETIDHKSSTPLIYMKPTKRVESTPLKNYYGIIESELIANGGNVDITYHNIHSTLRKLIPAFNTYKIRASIKQECERLVKAGVFTQVADDIPFYPSKYDRKYSGITISREEYS